MEKHTVTIKGKVYSLPPFNAGQFRRLVDPILLQAKTALERLEAIKTDSGSANAELIDLTLLQREIERGHAECALAALQNEYPALTMDDLETLTTHRISGLFNEIMLVTQTGVNEPGESIPPRKKKP